MHKMHDLRNEQNVVKNAQKTCKIVHNKAFYFVRNVKMQ